MNSEENRKRFACLRRILFVLAIVALAVLICTSIKQNMTPTFGRVPIAPSTFGQLGGQLGGILQGLESTISPLSPFPNIL